MKKKIDVVLLKPIRKLGKIGEIVEVLAGYARNYLIPQHLAAFATQDVIDSINEKKRQLELEQKHRVAQYQAWVDANKDIKLSYIREANDTGKLFGSVSAANILADLKEKYSLNAEHAALNLTASIKEIGKYDIELTLADELLYMLKVVIVRNETEMLNQN